MYGVFPLISTDMPQAAVDPLITSFRTARPVPVGGLVDITLPGPGLEPIKELGVVPVAYDEITLEYCLSSPRSFPFEVPAVTFPVAYEFLMSAR
jgi:hypothetical protein